jgi:putative chitinase
MTIKAIDIVKNFAPKAKQAYVDAFADPGNLLAIAKIDTPLRLAHFMTQCLHETGTFSLLIESGRYSAAGLGKMWDGNTWRKYFKDRDAMVAMAGQCARDGGEALFSLVYGGRMGNGAADTKDGWTYRGRGIVQTTGRESYARFGKQCGVDFEGDPDLVISVTHALKPALAEWTSKNVNDAADRNDITAVTKGINGGTIGLVERKAWFAKVWPFVIGPPPAKHATEWKVQAALDAAGYDAGNPDGAVGPRTKAAILLYCTDKKLPLSSAITPALTKSLKVS